MRKHFTLFTLVFILIAGMSFGQASKPFPQNVEYPHGYKASTVSSSIAEAAYNSLKASLMVTCDGGYRIIVTEYPERTRVEAIGFSMLLTAYYGDKDRFDGLYSFYKQKRRANANNMMAWEVTCDSVLDPGSATDGDIDVAFSLIIANDQWGGNYLDEAKNVIGVIKNSVVITCDKLLALAPGYSIQSSGGIWGGCSLTDIQYYTPAFFRSFAQVTGDTTWNKLADDTYTILNASAHETTGLVPDWQTVSGTPSGGPGGGTARFAYDACRVPWRIALDYLWFGNSKAKAWCTKVSNWAQGIGPANIRDGYNLDGTENNSGYHNSAFVGGFAVSAMCNNQAVANGFGTEMASLNDSYWFNLCTRTLYLFTMTGNFWAPETVNSLDDRTIQEIITLYPNPVTNGSFMVEGVEGIDFINVLDIYGKVVKSVAVTRSPKVEVKLDVIPGFYVVQFLSGNNSSYKYTIVN